VIVLYSGQLVAEIVAKDLTERAIMWPALGGETLREEALA
jgi:hypothetical protein